MQIIESTQQYRKMNQLTLSPIKVKYILSVKSYKNILRTTIQLTMNGSFRTRSPSFISTLFLQYH